MLFIKALSLAYITIIEIILSFLIAVGVDTFIHQSVRDDQHQSTPSLLIETAFFIGIIVVVTYIIKQFIKLIPSPFVGIGGFKQNTLRETNNLTTMTVFAIFFCNSIQNKITVLKKRVLFEDEHIL